MNSEHSKKMSQIEKLLYSVVIVLMFQILRNISTILYLGVLFSLYGLLYFTYFKQKKEIKFNTLELFFLITLIWVGIISLFYMSVPEYSRSLGRVFVTFPFLLFMIIYKDFSIKFINKVFQAFCMFIVLASCSVLYQIIFGPIPFFAEASVREGLVRYASLAGSLTALGTLGAYAIIIILFSGKFIFNKNKFLWIFIIVIGMLLSMQKSSVINLAIVLIFYIIFSETKHKLRVLFSCLFFLFLIFILYSSSMGIVSEYVKSIVDYTLLNSNSTESDFSNRLGYLPSLVIQYHHIGIFKYTTGIGFMALGGILGNSYPQSHNNFFDLLFSGGILHLLSFLLLVARVFFHIFRKKIHGSKINNYEIFYSLTLVLALINMSIGAASFYQPVYAVLIFTILFTYKNVARDGKERRNFE